MHRRRAVAYAQGGSYALSHGALTALAHSNCIQRVASLRCVGFGEDPSESGEHGDCEHSPRHEDAAVGLCMHLLGAVSAIDNKCMALSQTLWASSAPTRAACVQPLSLHPIKDGRTFVRVAIEHLARASHGLGAGIPVLGPS